MKVGLYFGSFNPIHVGHLIIANYMADYTDLDQIWLVVSPHNPHKEKKSLLADHHRLALVREAIEGNDKLKASDVEFSLPKPSYTATTLTYLKEKYPTYTFSLLMGEDNLRTFHKWFNYEMILENHTIYIYPRAMTAQEVRTNQSAEHALENTANIVVCNEAPVMNVSSSFIRNAIKEGKDVRYLVTENVYKYLDEMNFYR